MPNEMITIENISRRAFTIEVETTDENKDTKLISRNLNKGCTINLPKVYAEKLLKAYPTELRNLSNLTKRIIKTDNSKELKSKLEKKEKELENKNKEILSLKGQLKSEKKNAREQEIEINKAKKEIEKLKK